MKDKPKLIFWQNIISPHQSHFLNEIGKEYEVLLIVEDYISKDRQLQGWESPTINNVQIVKIKDSQHLFQLINECKKELNFFSGFLGMGYPNLQIAYKELAKHQKLNIITECPILLGKKKFLKILKYKLLYYKNRRQIAHIFAMGNLGQLFFKNIGFDSDKVSAFQYFIEEKELSNIKEGTNDVVDFIFVGQLIYRKGIDNLIDAFYKLQTIKKWKLSIVGSGDLENHLKQKVKNYGLENKIHFKGNLSNKEVRNEIEIANYLILPSRFDGWGAVVSEALSVGTKVICSDKCGSSILIDETNGYVYNENSINDLKESLEFALYDNPDVNSRECIIKQFNKTTKSKLEEFIEIISKQLL